MRLKSVLTAMALVVPMLVSSGIGWADLSTGLVAYYPFNGNANDASGNGHDGSVYGAILTTDWLGNPNSAYQFDGEDDYIEVANTDDAFSLTDAWTVSVWCQPLASVPEGTSGPIIWKTAVDGRNFDTFGLAWGPGDTWTLKLERASDDQDFGVVSSVYTPGQWYHLGGTYDGCSRTMVL